MATLERISGKVALSKSMLHLPKVIPEVGLRFMELDPIRLA
jgi:hypothetical protein